jgi:hypothetical protein
MYDRFGCLFLIGTHYSIDSRGFTRYYSQLERIHCVPRKTPVTENFFVYLFIVVKKG